jgi:hypothetical protein
MSKRLEPILCLDEEAERVKRETEKRKADTLREIESNKAEAANAIAEARAKAAELSSAYLLARETYDRLQKEVSLLESTSDDISLDLYRPQYSFETSDEYKWELERVYEKKKLCIKNELAANYPMDWAENDNPAEGRRLIRNQVRIMLRAFNAECDAAIARISWNNATRMVERVRKSFEAINGLGAVISVRITDEYLDLCLSELRLTHEHELKRREEKEIKKG